jgi:putative transposase
MILCLLSRENWKLRTPSIRVRETDTLPRHPRFCPGGIPVHVIQRGNNRQTLFTSDKDIAAYAHWLAEGAAKFELRVHGWIFMTNHVHLLLTPKHNDSVSRLMQSLGRRYVGYFNYAYARTGTLFEGRYRSSLVENDEYFLTCLRYIELNPVRAGMVSDPGDYQWSSYQVHGFGQRTKMWAAHANYLALGHHVKARQSAYRSLMNEVLDADVIAKIRHCVNTGLVLGTETFRNQVASMHN